MVVSRRERGMLEGNGWSFFLFWKVRGFVFFALFYRGRGEEDVCVVGYRLLLVSL